MESEGTPSPPEADLVLQALSGTLSAFEALMARYQKAVFNIAVWKSRNFFDAEDLTQDIFLAAFKALPTLKERENFGAWLFGIAYNRCHKWYQRERNKIVKIQVIKEKVARRERERFREARSGPLPASGGTGEPLSEVVSRLPPEVREALTLKYLEGLSYQDIEARLGINAHRIDYLIRKGKHMIRERLGRGQEEGKP